MTQPSDNTREVPEIPAPRVDKNVRHIYPSNLKKYLLIGAAFLVVAAGVAIYTAICIADFRHNMIMDELKSRSPAHRKILNAYSHCMGGKSPGHLACLGAVSKGAELEGIKPTMVKSILVEAGLVPGPAAKDPGQ